MKHSLFLLLFAVCSAFPLLAQNGREKMAEILAQRVKAPAAPAEQPQATATSKPSKPKQQQKGLFGTSKTVNNGATQWFFTVPDSLLQRELLVTVRYTSTPASTGKYGGELAAQQTVYFQKSPDGKLLLRARLLVNTADSTDAINRAIICSNEDPIIGSFKIEETNREGYKIGVSNFFLDDNPALGISSTNKLKFGLGSPLMSSSYIESVKSFPLNTEVRTVKTWTSSSRTNHASALTGKVTLGLNISFVLLPKVPMQRRLFDPRVGYFTDDFNLFGDHQQRVEPKRFITRWRLEPKNEEDYEKMKRGELIEPKKPIVYYIDPATPKQWRPYLIQGVNDWQKAFEKAGFKNAIYALEWPENDSTMSMEDARYSCIRYLASPIANAYGPHVHDPRSGEILESHICWYHNVMSLVHDWYLIQAATLDEAARKMNFDTELMGQLIRFVSSHEVGHTLGLRHNFGSSSTVPVDSLRSRCFLEKYGHTPSIMDYARFNYVAQPEDSIPRTCLFPRIGDYDEWAIEWGYRIMPDAYDDVSDHWELEKLTQQRLEGKPRLWFGDGETNRTNDARCQTEDLGDNAVKASEYGILNLKRVLPNLPEWTYESNDIYHNNIKTMYGQVQNQFFRYFGHVVRNLGGVYCDYKTIDQPGDIFSDEPRAKQLEAFRFICRHIIAEPAWLFDQPYMKRLAPSTDRLRESAAGNFMSYLCNPSLFERLTPTYPASEYIPALLDAIFTGAPSPTVWQQALQREAVTRMIFIFKNNSASPVRPVLLQQLKRLSSKLHASAANPHYASLADLIDRALVVK